MFCTHPSCHFLKLDIPKTLRQIAAVSTTMAHTSNRLPRPKSLLHHLVISPLPCFYSIDAECSQVVQTVCLTPKKPLNNLSTESNPRKLSELFNNFRRTDTKCSQVVQTVCLTPKIPLNNLRSESNPPKLSEKPLSNLRTESNPPKLSEKPLNNLRTESNPPKLSKIFNNFRRTDTKCSQVVQTVRLTPQKSLNNLRTEFNPQKLSKIFKTFRSIDTSPQLPAKSVPLGKLLSKLRTESDPQKIVQIFKQAAKHERFRRLRPVYKVTVNKLALIKQFDAIEEILKHSLQVSQPRSEGFIIRIITLYGVAGMPQHAIKTFYRMKSLNFSLTVRSFNALLNSLVESENPKLAHDLYKDIDTFGISADLQTYNIVVKAICKMNEYESAFSFLDEMRKHGHEPVIVTYNTILSAFYKQDKYKEADDLLGKMSEICPPDASTYNIRMSYLCRCHKTSDAEKLMVEMVSTGLNPDNIIFNTLIIGYCEENNLTEAKRVFSDMSSKGCDPNAVNYYTIIYFLSKEGHFDTAYEFCNQSMHKNWLPNLKIAKMLIDGLVKNNKVENARKVIEGMKERLHASYHKKLENI